MRKYIYMENSVTAGEGQMAGISGLGQGVAMRGPTYGEKAVGLTFNPSNDPTVQKVKELYAEIIDLMNSQLVEAGPSEKSRLIKISITEAQGAQMWAVKAITWK